MVYFSYEDYGESIADAESILKVNIIYFIEYNYMFNILWIDLHTMTRKFIDVTIETLFGNHDI